MFEVVIDCAGESFVFSGEESFLQQVLPESFAAFVSQRQPDWRVAISRRDAEEIWDGPRVEIVERPQGFELRAATFHAAADFTERQAWVEGPALPYALGTLLKHLLPAVLDDALVFHSALLVDGDQGYLCCGPSGCGKSTLAGLLPAHALCDELVAVRVEDEGYRAEALPLWEGRPGAARLAAVNLLSHGPRARRRRLEPGDAARRLAGVVLWPTARSEAMPAALARVTSMAESLPVFELEFAPSAEVWEVIKRGAERREGGDGDV